jgi:hypothetical protein
MTEPSITRETLLVDALAIVPGAHLLFRQHGVNPERRCGERIRTFCLGAAEDACALREVDALIDELNLLWALQASAALS